MASSLNHFSLNSPSFTCILSQKKVLKASRYGFNGKMKDNEVEGEGDVYDFGARMYDARLGRFLEMDRITKPFESSYLFATNSPLVYVDEHGKDNMVYLIITPEALKTLGVKNANDIINKTNEVFAQMGLETRCKLFDSKAPFDMKNLDKNDSYVVLDNKQGLSQKEDSYNLTSMAKIGPLNPESSHNGSFTFDPKSGNSSPAPYPGIGIGAEAIIETSKILKTDPVEFIAGIIVHGLIHNVWGPHISGTIAAEGAEIVNRVTGKATIGATDYPPLPRTSLTTIGKIISEGAKKLRPIIEDAFGKHKAKDNYQQNAHRNQKK